jgi:ubiquinone/menaquinone biosynthesis C-methylase UbiE
MLDTDQAVHQRYAAAAQAVEPQLCCPIDYDRQYLHAIPQEVIDRDYGCGDPSKHLRQGEVVLDLGSGGGKICFIAAQVVGPSGKVIGVDINQTMLELARRSQPEVARRIGYDNVTFRKGKIQDLAVDRDSVDAYLRAHPVSDEASFRDLESFIANLRKQSPMIADDSIDVVVSNCVLNLVDSAEKQTLFREIHRVLRPGGRAVISDIVSDRPVPPHLQQDPALWSGCISGAFQEAEFLQAFERAGFHGIEMPLLGRQPWQVVEGIEFRAATVIAYKGAGEPAEESAEDHAAIIYRGPFRTVVDDHDQMFERGQRCLVGRTRVDALTSGPYADHFIALELLPSLSNGSSASPISQDQDRALTVLPAGGCGPEGCC